MTSFYDKLKRRRLKFEVFGEAVTFSYRRRKFLADLDFEDEFVCLTFLHNTVVNKEDEAKLARLRKAVNAANRICRVNSYYDEDDSEVVFVLSHAAIMFVIDNPHFESELMMDLENCLSAQRIVNGVMKRKGA